MSEKEKKELDEIIARCRITKDDLYMEAECVEEYGEWIHMSLMGYSADDLREAAARMTNNLTVLNGSDPFYEVPVSGTSFLCQNPARCIHIHNFLETIISHKRKG